MSLWPEKTASDNTTSDSLESLRQAVREAEQALTKSAEDTSENPADKLEQMATKLAAADQDLLIKEASMYGAAMADGFIARLQSYGDTMDKTAAAAAEEEKLAAEFAQGVVAGYLDGLNEPHTKTASEAQAELSKFDPELVKMAAEVIDGFVAGYAEGQQEEYLEGAEKTAAAMDELIVDCYRRGYEDCDRLLKSLG